MNAKLITPSILNVEKEQRVAIIKKLIDFGIQWFHYDVMDNKFVPNTAIDVDEIINFHQKCPKHLSDVHLMVEDPIRYANLLKDYVTCLTIHYESFDSKEEIKKFAHQFSDTNWVGLAIKPNTPFSEIQDLVYLFDIILVMAVEPGFGGQKFIETTKDKIKEIKNFIDEEKLHTIIQVDGGINNLNSLELFKLGSTFNVVGSYLIKNLSKNTLNELGNKIKLET